MFGMSLPEIIVICIIGVIIFGPEHLPKMTYQIGKWVSQFRGAVDTFQTEVKKEAAAQGLDQDIRQAKEAVAEMNIVDGVTMRRNLAELRNNPEKAILRAMEIKENEIEKTLEEKENHSSNEVVAEVKSDSHTKLPNADTQTAISGRDNPFNRQATRLGWLFKNQNTLQNVILPSANLPHRNELLLEKLPLPEEVETHHLIIQLPLPKQHFAYIIRALPKPSPEISGDLCIFHVSLPEKRP